MEGGQSLVRSLEQQVTERWQSMQEELEQKLEEISMIFSGRMDWAQMTSNWLEARSKNVQTVVLSMIRP